MPFTPIHMGPGVLIKAVMRRHFSLVVFGWSQVLIDLEPLIRIIRGDPILHGFTHTFVGALLIGLGAAKPLQRVSEFCLRLWNRQLGIDDPPRLRFPEQIRFSTALVSCWIGTFSHVLLDGLMHHDLRPFAPWSDAAPWFQWISTETLHLVCFASAGIGVIWMLSVYLLRRGR